MKYLNPIISGFYPDPSICRVNDDYYLVTSSFEYFPGVPIFHSKDLINWKQLGHCLTRKSQLFLDKAKSSGGIFAPTLRYNNGKFYMITTNVTADKNFYVYAEKPEGPWSEPVELIGWKGIDPSLFFDEDGKVYLSGNSYKNNGEKLGCYQAEIDIETGELLTERKLIWEGSGGKAPESPHMYKINNMYYLIMAEGGTEYGHMVTVARSKSPYGPFEGYEKNPILSHRSKKSPIQCTGHLDLIQDHTGNWWAVFLAARPKGSHSYFHHLGRETFLAPVTWSKDGWPIIGNNGMVDLEMEAETLPIQDKVLWRTIDDFNEEILDDSWNFIRNPYENSWSLKNRKGYLTLNGSEISLNDLDSPSFIGRRQQHFECNISTLLEFSPENNYEEAGLTVIMNNKFHYEIALTKEEGKNIIIFRRRVDSLIVEKKVEYNYEKVILGIESDEKTYRFTYSSLDGKKETIGEGECYLLSTEVSGTFTGVYFGLYATGNGKKSNSPAYFDYFKYEI